MGLLAIRSHVDTTDDRLLGVEALLEVRASSRPTSTSSSSPSRRTASSARRTASRTSPAPSTWASTSSAASRISSAPWRRAPRSVRALAEHRRRARPHARPALRRDRRPALPPHRDAGRRDAAGSASAGRVAGSHLTSMHSMDNYYVSKLLPLIAEAGVAAIPNPLINIVLQGRHDSYPEAPRPHPREGDARPRHPGRLGPGLRARPLVLARHRRHARRRLHGPARRADDQPRGHARLLRHGDRRTTPAS